MRFGTPVTLDDGAKHISTVLSFGALLAAIPLMLSSGAAAQTPAKTGDASVGKRLAQACTSCHGGGASSAPNYPNLAGQSPEYIFLQLKNFESGERPNPVMMPLARNLSDTDMWHLAAYYSRLKPRPAGIKDRALAAQGESIFRNGIQETAVAACATCHGAKGHGVAPHFPRIAGQPSLYTVEQLKVYQSVPRFGNPWATVMKGVALRMTEQEMKAVAEYIAGIQ